MADVALGRVQAPVFEVMSDVADGALEATYTLSMLEIAYI